MAEFEYRVRAPGARTAARNLVEVADALDRLGARNVNLGQIQNAFARSQRGATGFAGSLRLINFSLLTTGALQAAGALFGFLDGLTRLQSRLSLVTQDTAEQNVLFGELFDIAQRTRQPIDQISTGFTRFQQALDPLGASLREVLDLQEAVSTSFAILGQGAQEANASTIQFAQAISSDRLGGDELRSIREQAPRLTRALVDGLNATNAFGSGVRITIGDLKRLGEQGELTGQRVADAVRSQLPVLREEFALVGPTIEQGFNTVSNSVIALGRDLEIAGIGSLIGEALQGASAAIDAFGESAREGFGSAGFAIEGVDITYLDAIRGAIDAIGSTMGTVFNQFIRPFAEGIVNFATSVFDFIKPAFDVLLQAVIDFGRTFAEVSGGVARSVTGILNGDFDVGANFRSGASDARGVISSAQQAFRDGALRSARARQIRERDALDAEAQRRFLEERGERQTSTGGGNNSAASRAARELERLEQRLRRFESQAFPAQEALKDLEDAQELFTRGVQRGIFTQERADEILARLQERYEEQYNPLFEINRQYAIMSEQSGLTSRELEVQTAVQEALNEARRNGVTVDEAALRAGIQRNQALQTTNQIERSILDATIGQRQEESDTLTVLNRLYAEGRITQNEYFEQLSNLGPAQQALASAYQDTVGPQQAFENGMAAINRLLQEGIITTEDYANSQRELRLAFLETRRDGASGFERAMLRIGDTTSNVAQQVDDQITNAFGAATDAIVEFAETGEFSIESFLRSIVAQFTQVSAQNLVGALFGSFSGGKSGTFGTGGFGFGDLFGGLFGGKGGGFDIGSLFGGFDFGSLFGGFGGLFGFKNGGSFTVGGNGGIDSELVAFKASPGERVDVSKPGNGGNSMQGSRSVTVNVYAQDVESFRRSENQVYSRAARALSVADRRNN